MTEINKPSYGVIVGRFQVPYLHDGHLELFKAVQAYHQHVIVFLGVAPGGASVHNPLDYDTRRLMIQYSFPNFIVCPIADTSSDETWSTNLDTKISEIVIYGQVALYGGRTSFVPHYQGKHKPIELQLKDSHMSGSALRNEVTNRVRYSKDFREGVIYSINNMYPHSEQSEVRVWTKMKTVKITFRKWVVSIMLAAITGWMLGIEQAPTFMIYVFAALIILFVLIA